MTRLKEIAAFLLVFIVGSTSCGSKNIVSYFHGDGSQLYFVTPSEMSGKDASLEIDFTYKYKKNVPSPVVCNFTLFVDPMRFREITSAHFLLDGQKKISLKELKIFFREVSTHQIRYGSVMTFDEFRSILAAKEISFTAETDGAPALFQGIRPATSFRERMEAARLEFNY